MEIVKEINRVRPLISKAKEEGKTIGLVPTMGALHAGHVSLIKAAKEKCDFVVVSIFLNPTQFGPSEDFEKYPRPLEEDIRICKNEGADVVFAPDVNEMYQKKNLSWVTVEDLTEVLCGAHRQGHFRGVATVCAKLFNIVQPDYAFLGQKDAQQTVVIKKMVADLNMPLEVVVCPTVREDDGLAISSRNKYLSAEQRKDAALIYQSLQKGKELIEDGVKDAKEIIDNMNKVLNTSSMIEIEYMSIVGAESLVPIKKIVGKVLLAIAVKIDSTRLIDNIVVDTGN